MVFPERLVGSSRAKAVVVAVIWWVGSILFLGFERVAISRTVGNFAVVLTDVFPGRYICRMLSVPCCDVVSSIALSPHARH